MKRKNVQRYLPNGNEQVAVTEEVYFAVKNPEWAEAKQHERNMKCIDENGNVCTKSCAKCDEERMILGLEPKEKSNRYRSIEMDMEVGGDYASTGSTEVDVATKLLRIALAEAITDLDPVSRKLAELLLENLTERQIATEMGKSQKWVNLEKPKLYAKLREALKHWR